MKRLEPTDRLGKISKRLEKLWTHPDFDDPKKKREILGCMPDYEEYLVAKTKLVKHYVKSDVHMRPMCVEPILNTAQEQWLFRQYNYYKYLANKCLKNEKLSIGIRLKAAEEQLKLADDVKKAIALANCRLVMKIVKKCKSVCYRFEDLLSEAYFFAFHAVDYFDWNRGFKFSTYCFWAVKNTLNRVDFKYVADGIRYSPDGMDECVIDKSTAYQDEADCKEYKQILVKLFRCLPGRELQIIQQRFFESRTLADVGAELRISKERVRQLERRGLEMMREHAVSLGIKIDIAKDLRS